ncbi:hypothetical protein IFM89_011955 [Coptis chinensis]|uniref:Alcohol dehydrogenase-like N-terminal domain-containing protein n=1 Tax=Coptis chinensis TaxID=261450 RepID=A0A835LGZ1_9MAGN|nr:hypothetical protein IFM89_011955 [Coptis chinensis]
MANMKIRDINNGNEEVRYMMINSDKAPVGVYLTIFGHEAIGVVESVGDYVEEVKEGDRVVPSFLENCNECIDCNLYNSEEEMKLKQNLDGDTRMRTDKQNSIHETTTLYKTATDKNLTIELEEKKAHVVKINTEIALDKACLLSCGVSTGLQHFPYRLFDKSMNGDRAGHGLCLESGDIQKDSMVAIFGLGVVGVMAERRKRRAGRTCDDHDPPSILRLSLRQQVLMICCAESKAINDPKDTCLRELEFEGKIASLTPGNVAMFGRVSVCDCLCFEIGFGA